jgi:cobalt/nickel transport system permease protein
MHMADALLSPAVGVALWAVSGLTLAWCARKVRTADRDDLVPLMGVLGAFVFAAMMINFTIPGTGSSGHIGGGLLLSILLGPHAAFIVIASVLTVQALFFADGGLLALGTNIFNLGVFPCFIGFALVYRPLLAHAGALPSQRRLGAITLLAALISSQLGALGVVTETQLSGISSLPLGTFLLLMQPIHLAIGLIEGLATAALILFMRQARPDLFTQDVTASVKNLAGAAFPVRWRWGLGLLAGLVAGLFSWFASVQPDGLEWSISRAADRPGQAVTGSALHTKLSAVQHQTALFPHYKLALDAKPGSPHGAPTTGINKVPEAVWPAIDPGTSLAGLLGGATTLTLVLAVGYLLRRRKARAVL